MSVPESLGEVHFVAGAEYPILPVAMLDICSIHHSCVSLCTDA